MKLQEITLGETRPTKLREIIKLNKTVLEKPKLLRFISLTEEETRKWK